jgi:histidine triad (HIT) family protein
VYENEDVYAFRDINPQAPVHVLVVPKTHVASVSEVDRLTDAQAAACLRAVSAVAAQENLAEGYRVISNCGPHACQSVPHLHFHILGGVKMS